MFGKKDNLLPIRQSLVLQQVDSLAQRQRIVDEVQQVELMIQGVGHAVTAAGQVLNQADDDLRGICRGDVNKHVLIDPLLQDMQQKIRMELLGMYRPRFW